MIDQRAAFESWREKNDFALDTYNFPIEAMWDAYQAGQAAVAQPRAKVSDEQIMNFAIDNCDISIDKHGRSEYEFDLFGLLNFARALLATQGDAPVNDGSFCIALHSDGTQTDMTDYAKGYEAAMRDEAALRKGAPVQAEPRKPDGYAYRYSGPYGGLRFNNGEEVNGSKPIESVPYFLGSLAEPIIDGYPLWSGIPTARQQEDAKERLDKVVELFNDYERLMNERDDQSGMMKYAELSEYIDAIAARTKATENKLICSKCGVDRLRFICPGNAMSCPVIGIAQFDGAKEQP